MVNFWLTTIQKENFEVVQEELLWGSTSYHERSLRKISQDDKVVFYLKGGNLGGIYTVCSEIQENEEEIFPRSNIELVVKLKPLIVPKMDKFSHFNERLIQNLSFIEKKDQWGMYMQNFARELSSEDYNIIEGEMKKQIQSD